MTQTCDIGMIFTAWNAALDGESGWTPRPIGRWMLRVGSIVLMAGIFLRPPWLNVALVMSLIGLALSRPPIHRMRCAGLGLAFALWIAISVIAALVQGRPGAGCSGTVYGWLSLPLTAIAATSPRWRRWAIQTVIAVAAAAAILASLQFAIGYGKGLIGVDPDQPQFFKGRGFNSGNLGYGFSCLVAALVLLVPAVAWSITPRWSWTGRIAALAGLAICNSRGDYLGFLTGLTTAFSMRGRRWLIATVLVGMLIVGFAAVRLAVSNPIKFQRTLSGEDARLPIWRASAAIIAEHPYFGTGGRDAYKAQYNQTFARVCPDIPNQYAKTDGAPHAHNWILALAAEYGVIAPVIYMAFVLSVIVACWRRRSQAPEAFRAACGLAVGGLVAGLFEPFQTQSVSGLGFHAFLGFCLGACLAPYPVEDRPATNTPAPAT